MSILYVVPTPIGNLKDITQRALSILQEVDFVAAEDTRNTGLLLKHFAIKVRLLSLHNYNEKKKTDFLLEKLKNGKSIALVSDAGTPLINDPGYYLVRSCREKGIRVVPLPGACAAITALSASGLPTDRFCYEGFLPARRQARQHAMEMLVQEPRTLIFYECPHRLLESLKDMIAIWGAMRYVVLAKELTKNWETIYGAPVGELIVWVQENDVRRCGEIVLVVQGYRTSCGFPQPEALRTLSLLLTELPLKKAAKITAAIYGIKKNELYRCALNLQFN